ncbi:MnmC family methyltransferase [Sulfurimonas sp. HSL-1716]|uniref:tRNA (5-methylaminomethyl-2-thiouridine)(34)-methyltransferase MnmD n=1 Tax=Hydrocurvibacter sulfurireducens TaxID=3131937 RepID=UPI0031F965DE
MPSSQKHTTVQSEDGTFTAFSKEFGEHYHSTKDGALTESLQKHVIPAFELSKNKSELTILDICFGLGFNTLATLYYMKREGIQKKLSVYSPEFDRELINSLQYFQYPDIFDDLKKIIVSLSTTGEYKDDDLHVSLYLGDAREYLLICKEKFDIVYQDAFSPAANPLLWTKEYFKDIKKLIKDDGVLTTYSVSLATRLALHQNGFNIYLATPKGCRSSTIASPSPIEGYEVVDMPHKILCNPGAKALSDADIQSL